MGLLTAKEAKELSSKTIRPSQLDTLLEAIESRAKEGFTSYTTKIILESETIDKLYELGYVVFRELRSSTIKWN